MEPTWTSLTKLRAELKKLNALFKKYNGSPPNCGEQFERWERVADEEKRMRAQLLKTCTPDEFLALLDMEIDDQIGSEEYENRGSPGPWRELKKMVRAEMTRRGMFKLKESR